MGGWGATQTESPPLSAGSGHRVLALCHGCRGADTHQEGCPSFHVSSWKRESRLPLLSECPAPGLISALGGPRVLPSRDGLQGRVTTAVPTLAALSLFRCVGGHVGSGRQSLRCHLGTPLGEEASGEALRDPLLTEGWDYICQIKCFSFPFQPRDTVLSGANTQEGRSLKLSV